MESGLGQTRARGVPQHLILRFWPIQARPTNFPRISFFWKETESKISVVFLFSLGGERGGGRQGYESVRDGVDHLLSWMDKGSSHGEEVFRNDDSEDDNHGR